MTLGLFLTLTTKNNVVTDICVHVLCGGVFSFLLGIHLGVEVLGQMVTLRFKLFEELTSLSKVPALCYIPTWRMREHIFTSLTNQVHFRLCRGVTSKQQILCEELRQLIHCLSMGPGPLLFPKHHLLFQPLGKLPGPLGGSGVTC